MSHSPIRWGYHRVSNVHGQSLELGRQELIDAGIPADKIWSEQVSGKSKANATFRMIVFPSFEQI